MWVNNGDSEDCNNRDDIDTLEAVRAGYIFKAER